MRELEALGDPAARAGMARFGIDTTTALGVSVTSLRQLAKPLRRDHQLALDLWDTGVHEARLLATMIDDPHEVTTAQMEGWAAGFNSWDLVDQCCGNLFDKTPFARSKALEWSVRSEEFVKRAGFALMACLAVHDKQAADEDFTPFFERIEAEANDARNFVKKAVNWALRQIGNRNAALNERAIQTGLRVQQIGSPPARWIASNALRELRSEAVQRRLDPAGQPSLVVEWVSEGA